MKRGSVIALLILTTCALFGGTLSYDGKDDLFRKCTLVNCDVEKVPNRATIDGFLGEENTNAVLYLTFDESDGYFLDHSPLQNHPTVFDNVFYNQWGKYGGCLNLKSDLDPIMEIPAHETYNELQTSEFTYNFWLKLKRKFGEVSTYINIMTFYRGLSFFGWGSGDKMSFRWRDPKIDQSRVMVSSSNDALSVGQWDNIWIVYTNGTTSLYINGVLHNESTLDLREDIFLNKIIFGYLDEDSYYAVDGYIDDFYLSSRAETAIERAPGIITTKPLDLAGKNVDFVTVTLDKMKLDTNMGAIELYASSDGGSNWTTVTNDVASPLPSTGQSRYDELTVKVILRSYTKYEAGTPISSTIYSPEIESFTVTYATPEARTTSPEYYGTGDLVYVEVTFPYEINALTGVTNMLSLHGKDTFTNISVIDPLLSSDEKTVTFAVNVTDDLVSGFYDLRLTGYTYKDSGKAITTTFERLFAIDQENTLDSEDVVAWQPDLIDARSHTEGFANANLVIFNQAATPVTVSIDIFSSMGAPVRKLATGDSKTGMITYTWDGKDDNNARVPSGFYYAKVTVDNTVYVKRIYVLH